MQCPKCKAEQADGNLICGRCGIVFEKYWKYHPRPGESAPTVRPVARPTRSRPNADHGLRGLLLPTPTGADRKNNPLTNWAKAALLVVLGVWGLRLIGSS
ncbi:MAG: TFIIB-type zinc ribbon-containing protein, partial [Thiohalocapsa sp.]